MLLSAHAKADYLPKKREGIIYFRSPRQHCNTQMRFFFVLFCFVTIKKELEVLFQGLNQNTHLRAKGT